MDNVARFSAKRPHACVCLLQINCHPVMDTGECEGATIDEGTLAEYGLKPRLVLTFKGFDKNDVLTKVRRWLDSAGKA